MKSSTLRNTMVFAVALASLSGLAETMDRPQGIKLTERMTLMPYVAVSAAYDSNVESGRDGDGSCIWMVNPSMGLNYKSEQWSLDANAFYMFRAYSHKPQSSSRGTHSYGENLTLSWTDSLPNEKGWSFQVSESYRLLNETDDMSDAQGRSWNRDRSEFDISAALQRRITDRLHAGVHAGFYWLDYDNSSGATRDMASLYGWDRWQLGGEIGYALSPWTDFLLVGSYQSYRSDGKASATQSSGTDGLTVQGGFGTYATERIQYRVLGGWSNYKYDEGGDDSNGFTYSISGNWVISDTWKTTLLAQSMFQPAEREAGSSQRVDMISWGIAHSMVRNKLTATFDTSYRRETREYTARNSYDYDLDYLTFRFGLNYTLNRFCGLYSNFEYRNSMSSSSTGRGASYDYDRYRVTVGMRFTY